MPELAVRVERVGLLLATMNDPYPRPRGALDTQSGPSASRYLPCETCRASGWVHRRGGWVLCLVCDGRAWKRRQDEPQWDAYLEMPLEDAVGLPTAPPARQVDPALDASSFAWERVRATYDRHGSYRELRLWLEWLADAAPWRYRLVRTVLVDGDDLELDAAGERELRLGVLMIAVRMRTVRVPKWLLEREASNGRNQTIQSLAAEGRTAGEIARKLGIPKSTVRKYLKRMDGRLTATRRPASAGR